MTVPRQPNATLEERALMAQHGVSRALLSLRLKLGWSRDKALSTPPNDGIGPRQRRFVVGHDERDDDGAWRCRRAPRLHISVTAFARSRDVDSGTLFARIRAGIPAAVALTIAKHVTVRVKYRIGDEPAVEVARDHGVPQGTLYYRLGAGWSLEDAATRPINESMRSPRR